MKNKKEKINLRKFLFVLPLLLLALITTVVATFAWWNTLTVEKDFDGTIGDSVVLKLTAADFSGVLVPEDVYDNDEDILNQGWVKVWSTNLNFTVDRTDTTGDSFVLTITPVKIFVDGVDRSSYFDLKILDGEDDDLSYDINTAKTLTLKLSFRDILEEEQEEVRTTFAGFAGEQLTITIEAKITAQPQP
ncbi:MAG: hypothetical protein M0Q88_00845 [Bacilli bacterium]|nr:hypothetical protein [Bacilli bacterium]